MLNEKYDLLVFIGRFQPFHMGHKRVVHDALKQAREVLILVGSAFQARTIKNPFRFPERRDMILSCFSGEDQTRMSIYPLRDYLYSDAQWITQVQNTIEMVANSYERVGIIGYEKDESSWYLRAFPQYDFVELDYNEIIDATRIREMWLSDQSPQYVKGVLDDTVHEYLYSTFKQQNPGEHQRLIREQQHIIKYKEGWKIAPFPPTFVTCDAVIIQSGHVLLVQRKSSPGENLWALPGGFIQQNEPIREAMIRELREETRIKVPEPVIRGSIVSQEVFDAPGRSLRGRTITHAFLVKLADGPLPKIKGSDDAKSAKWVTFADFKAMEEEMFEDHFHIVNYFLGNI